MSELVKSCNLRHPHRPLRPIRTVDRRQIAKSLLSEDKLEDQSMLLLNLSALQPGQRLCFHRTPSLEVLYKKTVSRERPCQPADPLCNQLRRYTIATRLSVPVIEKVIAPQRGGSQRTALTIGTSKPLTSGTSHPGNGAEALASRTRFGKPSPLPWLSTSFEVHRNTLNLP